ncbi:roadblock/LC7 domain-containing protein [Caldimonas tepidiphila]|uniref:roadblock/LC7 domain-containing protein n=1 Tax=Caldimonas tepidiphila TaxID=2315841 RepID=UPI000E5BA365|nr:roadblock/LC7 domain-containing protein [Caldimonas tepidiphila]
MREPSGPAASPLASSARSVLRNLQASSEHIQASALVSGDGLVVAAVLGSGVDEDRFGAMCASLLALATRAAREVDRGELRQIILDGAQGVMLLTRAGGTGVLTVAAANTINLGKLILDTRATAQKLATLFAGAVPPR